jgi:hypothetical protein
MMSAKITAPSIPNLRTGWRLSSAATSGVATAS